MQLLPGDLILKESFTDNQKKTKLFSVYRNKGVNIS